MKENELKELLSAYKKNKLSEHDLIKKLKNLPFENIGIAKIDHHRYLRKGIPEAILASHKTPQQVLQIWERMEKYTQNILATRANEKHFHSIKKKYPEAVFYPLSGCIILKRDNSIQGAGLVLVISGGTSDIPVAEEAFLTLDMLGYRTEMLTDVGVAGLHRLLHYQEKIREAKVIIAVAGMEGALPGLVAGFCAAPVIAVPTSTGYGSHFQGLASLLTMLNSCSPGIAVVNIDNGYGAACVAALIIGTKAQIAGANPCVRPSKHKGK
ncbi:MAG: hypothetical protein A2Y62_17575 [Candidatus Fischerbacteria bacterium RBG_13_37_8]|uniref:PurE domain-containing protein n=1 Tax=Candidatus Fischerbacteria bacterium RBG_13_37_8 TaxID=1817863 RepID=A0A1F5VP25_9BACT|nr:MAG: hypothetical protein A2Y62_17575 [Candidatus Fischerbacteria bacterium RBG_13_37_8]